MDRSIVLQEKTLKLSFIAIVLSFFSATLFAANGNNEMGATSTMEGLQQQPIRITGHVVDDRGDPAIGANVSVKGTTNGTITDIDGNFILQVPSNESVLVVSYIGYIMQEIPVKTTRQFNILLKEASQQLEEVVVVGYGVQKKESVVGAISQVDNTALLRAGTQNITNAIAGKLSGVLTIQQTGQPGKDQAEIIIRGVSSWNSSAPLVLVDGVERDFTDLDPNEINTVSVLKDASATAVFGAKGANGVVIVTTKRGFEGKPQMDFSASYGMRWAARIPEHYNAETTLRAYNDALMNAGGSMFQGLQTDERIDMYMNPRAMEIAPGIIVPAEVTRLLLPDVNWFKEATRSFAPTTTANFNITGGTRFVKYFCSLGYLHEGDFFKSYNDGLYCDTRYLYDRFNYRANLDFSLTSTTQLQVNAGGDVSIQNQPKTDTWREIYCSPSVAFPAYYPEWMLDMYPDLYYPNAKGVRYASADKSYSGFSTYQNMNPLKRLMQTTYNNYTDSKLFTDLVLNQKLDFITKGLSVGAKVSLSTYFKVRSLYQDQEQTFTYQFRPEYIGSKDNNPWLRDGDSENMFWNPPVQDVNVGSTESGYYTDLYYEANINYNRTFKEKHAVTGLLLFNRQNKRTNTDFAYLNEAWVARGTYAYDNKYLFEVNLGYTGSERFAASNRFGFFPSGAIGWVISEEKFFKKAAPWVERLKFRYSDGLVGSDAAPARWLYQGDYSRTNLNTGYGNVGYTQGTAIMEGDTPNVLAQWEEARKRDLGMELSLFKGLINITADIFDEKREKMLLTPRYNFIVGNSSKAQNLGSLKKQGYEVEVEFRKRTAYDLDYNIKAILGYNENRILVKDDLLYAPEYMKEAGKPLESMNTGVIQTGSGFFTSVDDIHNNPSPTPLTNLTTGDYKYLDYNSDGVVSILDRYPVFGSKYPPYTFSFGGGFRYKNFEFSILFAGNLGKYVDYNMLWEGEFFRGDLRLHGSQIDYWRPDNQKGPSQHATLRYIGTAMSAPNLAWGGGEAEKGYSMGLYGHLWRRANYLRLKDVYLAYNIKPIILKKAIGISNIVIYASGNNLFTLTELPEGDPERKDFYSGFYPQMATVKLGLKVGF